MPKESDAKEMPEGFAPSDCDVLVGWARQNFHHAGNCFFRDLISETVPRYMKADSKASRGEIITEIVDTMQAKSPSGTGFLKLNPYTARWAFIGTDKAKDKVGHALRKAVLSAEASTGEGREGKDDTGNSGGEEPQEDNTENTATNVNQDRRPVISPLSSSFRKRGAPDSTSILKSGRQAKYRAHGVTPLENAPLEANAFSRLFPSPTAEGAAAIMRSPTGARHGGYLPYGISPVARDMFDEQQLSRSPPYANPYYGRATTGPPTLSPPQDHNPSDQGQFQYQGGPSPQHAPPYFPLGAFAPGGHPPLPMHPLATDTNPTGPPPQQTMAGQEPMIAPPAAAMPPPPPLPPPSYPYYPTAPPGYYFYPGYGPVPPPPSNSAVGSPPPFPAYLGPDLSGTATSFPPQYPPPPLPPPPHYPTPMQAAMMHKQSPPPPSNSPDKVYSPRKKGD